MSRVPQPVAGYPASFAARNTPAPADYSDEISAEDLEALRKSVQPEIDSTEWELVDGPAW